MTKKIFRPYFATATDPRVLQTREALRKALLELLNEKSITQISIRNITTRAGVGYTTFFRHHQCKEDLLKEIVADEIRRVVNSSFPSLNAVDKRTAALTLCRHVDGKRTLWKTLLTGGASGIAREEFINTAREIAAHWERPPEADWLPSEVGIILVVSAIIELLSWWLREEEPVAPEQVATIMERLIIAPAVNAG